MGPIIPDRRAKSGRRGFPRAMAYEYNRSGVCSQFSVAPFQKAAFLVCADVIGCLCARVSTADEARCAFTRPAVWTRAVGKKVHFPSKLDRFLARRSKVSVLKPE